MSDAEVAVDARRGGDGGCKVRVGTLIAPVRERSSDVVTVLTGGRYIVGYRIRPSCLSPMSSSYLFVGSSYPVHLYGIRRTLWFRRLMRPLLLMGWRSK